MNVKEYLELDKKNPWYAKEYDGNREADKELMRQYNRELIEKYPWLLPKNRWSGDIIDDYDWDFSELDAMPEGWRIAFGEQMCEEIQAELVKYGCVDEFMILEIKEKYGSLRFYTGSAPESVFDIIDKYERLSEKVCIRCGKKAEWISMGWISPWCDGCKGEIESHDGYRNEFKRIDEVDEVDVG